MITVMGYQSEDKLILLTEDIQLEHTSQVRPGISESHR